MKKGFAQASKSWPGLCPFPTWQGRTHPGQLDTPSKTLAESWGYAASQGKESSYPVFGAIRDPLTVVTHILFTPFLYRRTVCPFLSVLVTTSFRVQHK